MVLADWTRQIPDPIDVIIDDGSHIMEHLKTSFMHLFPKLSSGGIYVLEDLGTCYMPEYGGGLHSPSSMIELLKSFVDNINEYWSNYRQSSSDRTVAFYPNLCFVYKK